ncbi:MAG: ferrochelatase [Nitrospiraceae bacterium]|nr:MAG: ferrochelatase [Nitrospiraceae bacterium]
MTSMKQGVVLLNLGGPDSLQSVKPFLYNLFSDREIIRLGPPFLQKPVAWLIASLRSKKTEAMYRQIGGKSPILEITKAQAEALEKALNEESRVSFKLYIGMRYWHPFIMDTVKDIINDGVGHLTVLSMYPHYSKATTGSSVAEFKRTISRVKSIRSEIRAELDSEGQEIEIQYIEQWHDFPPYIEALAELISQGLSEFSPPSTKGWQGGVEILYSAHSLPQSFIDEGDPYLDHIKSTIATLNSLLLTRYSLRFKWHLSFQSKTGPVKWLEPTTEETIIGLANEGCKNLFVVPVSFVSDHIETLYEIDILYEKLAKEHGINLKRCRALNTSDKFILALKELVMAKIGS